MPPDTGTKEHMNPSSDVHETGHAAQATSGAVDDTHNGWVVTIVLGSVVVWAVAAWYVVAFVPK